MTKFYNFKNTLFFICAIVGLWTVSCSQKSEDSTEVKDISVETQETFVKTHGHLQVIGRDLCDSAGVPIQLKGMSYLDIEGERNLVNPDFFRWLRDDWGSSVVRAAMYTEHDGKFVAERKYDIMRDAIDYAIETGLYILVDWHNLYDGFPMKYKAEAIEFFTMIATEYKGCPNILYEICNEPNGEGMTWAKDVKPYAISVTQAIREVDPDALIIVGSPKWSRRLDQVAASPLEFENILYTFHIYTGSDDAPFKKLLIDGAEAGLPIFITEWGTTLGSGDGGVYIKETADWFKIVNKYNLSWCNWSVSERDEDSCAIAPNTPSKGGTIYHLTPSGTLVRSLIRGSLEDIFFADGFESESFRSRDWVNKRTGISEDEYNTGYYSAKFKKNSQLTKAISTEIFSNIEVNFFYKSKNFVEGDIFRLEWKENGKWVSGEILPASSDKWKELTVELPESAEGDPDFEVRLISEFKGEDTNVFMDDFSISMTRESLYIE